MYGKKVSVANSAVRGWKIWQAGYYGKLCSNRLVAVEAAVLS
jgi:hypothetical protein